MAFTFRNSGELVVSIETDLADNNAGLISAEDIRSNLGDLVVSVSDIVASGDTDVRYGFWNDVRARKTASVGGTFIAESGVIFPNSPVNAASRQVQPFLGVENLQHNSLAGLTLGDPHTQYVSISGHRPMQGNLPMASYWIGASGLSDDGIKFTYHPTGTTISTSGTLKFGDNSIIKSGRGVAKAWVNFDASGVGGTPVVNSAYNVSSLVDLGTGKFRLVFNSGVMGSGKLVAVASSNSRSSAVDMTDFELNTVGIVSRSGVDPNVAMTVAVLNLAGQYIDAEMIDVVVFADGPSVTTDSVSIS